jgi:hypothetical protein
VGEYNAPWPNLYPEATAAMEQAIASVAQAFDGTGQAPEQAALANLYERMASLPPQLQMFMRGCPPALEAKRDRINCRGDLAVFGGSNGQCESRDNNSSITMNARRSILGCFPAATRRSADRPNADDVANAGASRSTWSVAALIEGHGVIP